MAKKARKKKSKAAKRTAAALPTPAVPAPNVVASGAGAIDDDLAASMQRATLSSGFVSASTGPKLDTLPIEILEKILKPVEFTLSAFLDLKRVSRSFASVIKSVSSRTTVQHTLGDWQSTYSSTSPPSHESAVLRLCNPRTESQISAQISGQFKISDIEAFRKTWREAGRSTPWPLSLNGKDLCNKFLDGLPWNADRSMAICYYYSDPAHPDLFNNVAGMALRKPFADGLQKASSLKELTLVNMPCDFINATMVANMRKSLGFLRLIGQPILPTCTLCSSSPLRDLVTHVRSIMITSAYIRGRTEADLTTVLLQAQDSLEKFDVCISGHPHGRQHNLERAIAANVQSIHMAKLFWIRILIRDTVGLEELAELRVSLIAPELDTAELSVCSIGWLYHSAAGLANVIKHGLDFTPGNLLVQQNVLWALRRCTALRDLSIDMSTDDGSKNRIATAALRIILQTFAESPQIPLHHICIKPCASWDGTGLHGLLIARLRLTAAHLVNSPIKRLCVHGHSFSSDVALQLQGSVDDCLLEAA